MRVIRSQVDHGWFRYRRAAVAGVRLISWPLSAQVWPWSWARLMAAGIICWACRRCAQGGIGGLDADVQLGGGLPVGAVGGDPAPAHSSLPSAGSIQGGVLPSPSALSGIRRGGVALRKGRESRAADGATCRVRRPRGRRADISERSCLAVVDAAGGISLVGRASWRCWRLCRGGPPWPASGGAGRGEAGPASRACWPGSRPGWPGRCCGLAAMRPSCCCPMAW